ncbi:hypothetical protein TSAR_006595 [Trichomalopsis sarcophagae]|uniref:Ionotropic glutamate receptor C-terminal domain-containing protein n=1 Tax=Trichomalopsis sarcophagae TaxID=543379 RepID=A0A232ENV9_9HYME|nr:hypothetical protein TSAR_006595 [Trichomalopsis sarcophagae]
MERINNLRMILFDSLFMISVLSHVHGNQLEEYISRNRSMVVPLASMNLIEHCFVEKAEPVVLFGNWSANIIDLQSQSWNIVQIMGFKKRENICNYTNKLKIYKIDPDSELFIPYPVQKFVIAEVNLSMLKLVFHKIKHSIWWNVNGFYVVQNIHVHNSCKNARSLMQIVWEFNILSVLFICHDLVSGLNLYTFNPYNEEAPNVWKRVPENYRKNYANDLTLFNRPYDLKSSSMCEALNFIKTMNLSSYPIQLCTREGTGGLRRLFEQINNVIWTKMNAVVNVTIVETTGIVDSEGLPNFATKDVLDGKFDGFLAPDFRRDLWKNEVNTFITSRICYVTNKEELTFFEQLSEVFPSKTMLVLLLLSLTTMAIFKYLLKESFSEVAIDVLRVVTLQSTLREPVTVPARAIFVCIIFNFMWVSWNVESNLMSILTVSQPMRAVVTTEQDLIDRDYKIHSRYYFEQFNYASVISDLNVRVRNVIDCLEVVDNDAKNACLDDCTVINFFAKENQDIHIAHMEPKRYYVLVYRDDFPLKERVSTVYHRLLEHGIINKFSLDQMSAPRTSSKKLKNPDNYKRITMQQIKFVVYFIIIGDLFAVLVFFVELCSKCKKK